MWRAVGSLQLVRSGLAPRGPQASPLALAGVQTRTPGRDRGLAGGRTRQTGRQKGEGASSGKRDGVQV